MAKEDDGQSASEAASAEPAPSPDFRDLYLRAVAELDNYRKRVEKDRAAMVQAAAEGVVRRLLEPIDSIERAVSDLARLKAESPAELQVGLTRSLDGMRALHRQLSEVLAIEGLAPVDAEGAEFDPAYHEALARVPHATVPAGTVLQVLRPGYMLRGRVIRPAAVAVSAGPPEAAAANPDHDSGRAPAKGADGTDQT